MQIAAMIISGLIGSGIYLWGYFTGKKHGRSLGWHEGYLTGLSASRCFTFGSTGVVIGKTGKESGAE